MTHYEAILRLRDAWPRQEFTDREAGLYGERLSRFPAEVVNAAVNDLIDTSTFRPSIGQVTERIAERALNLPTTEEAWEIARTGRLMTAPDAVRGACEAVGGRWAILHGDNPETIRAQFRQFYKGYRQTALNDFVQGDRHALPPAARAELGPTMAALPETEYVHAPPVHARFIRRASGREMEPPTEAEKQHAIEVLREGPPEHGDPDPVYVEAERIFAEAST